MIASNTGLINLHISQIILLMWCIDRLSVPGDYRGQYSAFTDCSDGFSIKQLFFFFFLKSYFPMIQHPLTQCPSHNSEHVYVTTII